MHGDVPPFSIEFYESSDGGKPVLRWIDEDLSLAVRHDLGYAMWRVLQHLGVGVCATEFGRQLGGGLFEFRLRTVPRGHRTPVVLRVFCHATADRVVLLLGGYDQGCHPSVRRQSQEIRLARRRLSEYRSRPSEGPR